MCVNYLNGLKPYITRQVDFSRCTSLQSTYKEAENSLVKADSLIHSQRDTKEKTLVVNLREAKGATAMVGPSPTRDMPHPTPREAPVRVIALHSTDNPNSAGPRRRKKRTGKSVGEPVSELQAPHNNQSCTSKYRPRNITASL